MEPYLALRTAVVLLAIAALGGVTMALIRLRGADRPPSSFAMAHGLLAAAALTLLLYSWFTVGIPQLAQAATVVLGLAALGGTYVNLRFHSQMLPLPIPLMIGHALLAVAGFTLLLVAVIQTPG
jgi:hypothetical protein